MKHFIKVYNHNEAPNDAIYVDSYIERNGVSDYQINNFLIPNISEREVHLYYIIK